MSPSSPDPAEHRSLPERVSCLIREKEAESERLIGWMQLAIAGLWAGLFVLSPRPADAPAIMLLEPVPIALGAYILFTAGRLALAYTTRLPPALIAVSIFADVGILLWLVWSFHGQYGQPAAFSLKVPTFSYIFVFIGLRALRFDYRLVLASGGAAAAGWVGLSALVVERSAPDAITRSFVDYMNGNRILLGAEFDKVLTILMVTCILALAVRRARAMLVTAVRQQVAAQDMRRFLADGVADAITGADRAIEAGEARERMAAILMLDIRGFTKFSKTVSPRDVVAMLTSLHRRLIPIIEGHGGVVDKFLGDGAMITFGAVEPSPSSAADALRALDDILAESEAWQKDLERSDGQGSMLQMNAAVTMGPVVFATLGSAERLEYTVIGEAVNLAAKLEKHNKVFGSRAVIPAETLTEARKQGYEPPAPEVMTRRTQMAASVSGVGDALDLVSLAPAT